MVRRAFGRGREPDLSELGPQRGHRIVVTHPHLLHRSEPAEELVVGGHVEIGLAPLAPAVYHRPAVVLRDFLMPEAESHDGHVQIVDLLGIGRVLPPGGETGAAGNDDAPVVGEGFAGIFGLADLG